jgi:ComF family protein
MALAWLKFFARLSEKTLDVILPQECVCCGAAQTWLCQLCFTKIQLTSVFPCWVCRRPSLYGEVHGECRKQTELAGTVMAVSERQAEVKEAIHHFKYENLPHLAKTLGQLLSAKVNSSPLLLSFLMSAKTKLLPVPLHAKRAWERGFNQSELLAAELASQLDLPVEVNAVSRSRNTKTQTNLPRKKRLRNVAGSFRIVRPELVKDYSFVIIDDVATTGATVAQLAAALKTAGAHEIWAAVLARG